MFRKRNTIPLPPAVSVASAGRLTVSFPYIVRVKLAITVYTQTPSTTPWSPSLPEGGLVTAFPYIVKVRFAVIVYAADSFHHSVVPLNAVSVASASEGGLITAFPYLAKEGFALIVRTGGASPSPTNICVCFGDSGVVCGYLT